MERRGGGGGAERAVIIWLAPRAGNDESNPAL